MKDLRSTIENENNNNDNNGNSSVLKDELTSVKAENIALKKEIDKLNYRIRHLIKALDEEEKSKQ